MRRNEVCEENNQMDRVKESRREGTILKGNERRRSRENYEIRASRFNIYSHLSRNVSLQKVGKFLGDLKVTKARSFNVYSYLSF